MKNKLKNYRSNRKDKNRKSRWGRSCRRHTLLQKISKSERKNINNIKNIKKYQKIKKSKIKFRSGITTKLCTAINIARDAIFSCRITVAISTCNYKKKLNEGEALYDPIRHVTLPPYPLLSPFLSLG
jgi:hypothetical protein